MYPSRTRGPLSVLKTHDAQGPTADGDNEAGNARDFQRGEKLIERHGGLVPGEPAPPPREPDPEEFARIAAHYGIEIVGPPPTLD
jgi:hypothetical protein